MKLIRCLNCNKVLGEVEGKAKIKCKMARCHCMNVIDTDAGTHLIEAKWAEPDKEYKWVIGSNPDSTFGKGVVEKLIPTQLNETFQNMTAEEKKEVFEMVKEIHLQQTLPE